MHARLPHASLAFGSEVVHSAMSCCPRACAEGLEVPQPSAACGSAADSASVSEAQSRQDVPSLTLARHVLQQLLDMGYDIGSVPPLASAVPVAAATAGASACEQISPVCCADSSTGECHLQSHDL